MNKQLYESLINDQIEHHKNAPKREHIFRISQLHMCERKILYGVLGYQLGGCHDGKSLLTLGIGTQIHEVVQGTLERNGYISNLEHEMVLEELSLNGHCDGFTFVNDNNEVEVVRRGNLLKTNAIFELKTINAQGFMRLFWNKSAKPEHIHQVNCYMGLTGFRKACIFYINKNGLTAYNDPNSALKWPSNADSYLQTFIVDFNEKMWYDTKEKLKRLNQVYSENVNKPLEEHNLPPKLPSGHKECTYCEYKSICKPSRAKKIKEL